MRDVLASYFAFSITLLYKNALILADVKNCFLSLCFAGSSKGSGVDLKEGGDSGV